MTTWYYSDAAHTRLGPIGPEDLVQLHQNGQLLPTTLVWREGWGDWRTWRDIMPEVVGGARTADTRLDGIATTATSVASAPTANPYALAEPQSPYAPPRASVIERAEFYSGGEVVYASFRKRLAAYLIDGVVVTAIASVVQVAVMMGFFGVGMNAVTPESMFAGPGAVMMIVGVYIIPLALQAAYYAMFHASTKQATLGKMAVGIKVTDDAGHRITLARGIGRFFAFMLSGLTLGIGYLMAAFTDRKRGLHDMIASTLVVDRWAYTQHPDRQRRELDTVTVVILWVGGVLFLGLIALIVVAIGLAAQAN